MPDATPPIPPRFRWLLRGLIAGAVLLGLLAGLRAYWGHRWHSRFEAQLQAIRDRGEPIDVADFNPPLPADADNAAVYLRRAMRDWPNVPGSSQQIIEFDWFNSPDQYPDPITDNAAYLTNCEPALALIEQAAQASTSHWGKVYTSPLLLSFGTTHLGESRRLARLISDAATRAVDAGQPEQAIRLSRLIYKLSESLIRPPVSIIDHLVAISMRSMAFIAIEEQLPLLELPENNDAAAMELRELIEAMRDEDLLRIGFRHAMQFERMFNQDSVAAVAEGRLPVSALSWGASPGTFKDTLQRWLFKPLYYRDGCVMMDYLTRYGEAAAQADRAAFMQIDEDFAYLDGEHWRFPLASVFLPSLGSAGRTYLQNVTQQRLALTAIALKLYELDHGHTAASLDDLVPQYIKAIPIDPMDPAGGAIRYLPEGGALELLQNYNHWMTDEQIAAVKNRKLPLIYSVGRDGVDNGGLIVIDSDGTPYDNSRWRGYNDEDPTDHWFLLAPTPDPIPDPNSYTGHGFPYYGLP